ncbi:S41 family peptidase [uncultured Aquimarina sp.]|uniref:S41 family peptidase n=1 Tax=uncultured Aquimarina sp. TaxID=575652 RepID=UPI002613FE3C|nr:S41 family peptidase [uncultured Aquimarina sp.]
MFNKFILSSIITFFLFNNSFSQQFAKEKILADLDYLNKSIKEAHYNIYAYTPKKELDSAYSEIKKTIHKDSLNLLQVTNLFQKLTSAINNGHTEIDFPINSYKEYAYNKGTVFPLEISFENGKNLIRKNFSNNSEIKVGAEILSINGIPMKDILSKIYPQISAERTYLKNVKIEVYSFPRYYWQVFGKQDHFEIETQDKEKIKKYLIDAVNLIDGYETKRTEVLNAKMSLQYFETSSYLNPGNFGGDEKAYQKFIDSAFSKINKSGKRNLIIDLRNNAGGDNSFSDYLVSYIANKPFRWNSKLTIKTSKFLKEHTRKHNDTTDTYFKNILNHTDNEVYNYDFGEFQPQEKNKRFQGKVYVLINRQSHSQSAVTAAQIQDYKFGTIVGEETGDYPSLYASLFQYSLPNTGIVVKVPKGYIVRVNGSKKQEGVIPDIFIRDHLLDETDEILDQLLEKIN